MEELNVYRRLRIKWGFTTRFLLNNNEEAV